MDIIGIAGGTGSGKTTVVRKIIESLPAHEVALIPQDSYYNDNTGIPMEERRKINIDNPCAFDRKLLIQHIKPLKEGQRTPRPDVLEDFRGRRFGRTPHPCHRTRHRGAGKNCTNGGGPLSGRTQTHASGVYRTDQTLCRPYHSPGRRKRKSYRNHAYLHPSPSQPPFGTKRTSLMRVRANGNRTETRSRLQRRRPDLWKPYLSIRLITSL